jgi:hypothetical protein
MSLGGDGTAAGITGGKLTGLPQTQGFELSRYGIGNGVSLSGELEWGWGEENGIVLSGVVRVREHGKIAGSLALNRNVVDGTLGSAEVVAGRVEAHPPAAVGRVRAWSSWQPPSGTTRKIARALAGHVANEYRLDASGAKLVSVGSGPLRAPAPSRRHVEAIALASQDGPRYGVDFHSPATTWTYRLCGRGRHCAIPGTATLRRGVLVRREALELALETFAYDSKVMSVIVYLPSRTGAGRAHDLLFFQRKEMRHQLARPLAHTLALSIPPLPTAADRLERPTIDRLTVRKLCYFNVRWLHDGGDQLLLVPLYGAG